MNGERHTNGIAEINNCIFDSNYAPSGGYIYVRGNAQIKIAVLLMVMFITREAQFI